MPPRRLVQLYPRSSASCRLREFPLLSVAKCHNYEKEILSLLHNVDLTSRRVSKSMSKPKRLSLIRLLFPACHTRRLSWLAICFGVMLFQGCALLQRPSETAAPSETSTQPAAPKSSPAIKPAPTPLAPVQPSAKPSPPIAAKLPQTGEASWYGAQHQGKQTASGTMYDQTAFTAAHPSLPFGSKIKVTNLANGKSVEVEITDRGPFTGNRIIDLSQAAAKALEMIDSGTTTVRLELPSAQ